jgi:hypothetical protein
MKEALGIPAGHHDSTIFKNCLLTRDRGLNLDIDGWLRGIGLAQYAEMFRANDIDGELLGRLTNNKGRDPLQQPLAMAKRHNAQILEIVCGARGSLFDGSRRKGAEDARHRRAAPSHGCSSLRTSEQGTSRV